MSADSDIRLTPEWLLAPVREFGDIYLDPCAEPSNTVGAAVFFTFDDDGLNRSWSDYHGCLVFVNPPYSRGQIMMWARKAVAEALTRRADIMFLVPSDTSTRWFAYLRENCDSYCLLSKRVGFMRPDGSGGYEPLPGAKFGSAIFYFGQQRRRFTRVFSQYGHVLQSMGPQEVQEAAQ